MSDTVQPSSEDAPLHRMNELTACYESLPDDELNRRFPSTRGLWREEEPWWAWTICSNIKPGEKLHEDNSELVFNNEQHWALIQEFGISNSLKHAALIKLMSHVCRRYRDYGNYDATYGTLKQHRNDLKALARQAKKLRLLAQEEPLLLQLLSQPKNQEEMNTFSERYSYASLRIIKLIALLEEIEQEVAILIVDNNNLSQVRTGSPPSLKSPERRYIWEPVFEFRRRRGEEVGYTEDGPIVRILRAFHAALKIKPPKDLSVRQAIQDFNGRSRTQTKS